MAYDYLIGDNGKPEDYAEALRLFEKAQKSDYYEQGYGPLAYMYYYGLGVAQDYHKSFNICLYDIEKDRGISKWGLKNVQGSS